MRKFKKCLAYFIGYKVVGKVVTKNIINIINSTGQTREFQGIIIMCFPEDALEEYTTCVCEALSLLKTLRPIEYRIVKRNLRYIVCSTGKGGYMGKYLHSCCIIPWDNWQIYASQIRSRLMVATLVHEAYHGEYFRRVGFKAYNDPNYEMKCRDREIKILLYFKRNSDESYGREYDNRICTLENPIGVRQLR